jgi:hypothetical protein
MSHLQRLYGKKKERRDMLWNILEDVEKKRVVKNNKKKLDDEEKAKRLAEIRKSHLK